MLVVKRLLIVVMVLVVPAVLTALSYEGAELVLLKTNRYIDPETIRLVTLVEFAIFFFIALLDARARWAAHSSN
jgi:sterol desaturase/sphingolipid hydroxylase (fatty acid hydroxylase superfamily)